jgi:hypothetical protein
MKWFIWALMLMLLGSVPASAQFEPSSYEISFSSNTTQESILRVLIHQECARLLSASQPIMGYCTQNPPPDDGQCTCTPSVAQKRSFIVQRYLVGGFTTDRDRVYRQHGSELGRLYPQLDKATRDVIDAAAGLTPLP